VPAGEFKDQDSKPFDAAAGIDRFYLEAAVGSGGGTHDGIIR
jgi:hypothetical protein